MAYEQLGELVARSRHVVFFGGAGVSTHIVQLHRKKDDAYTG